jgi:prepilin-type N-terminal cleavage/methylation domain-containing protein/prepilin-type processing-associated H-X9-DG protein
MRPIHPNSSFHRRPTGSAGFTLTELLVVILIIAALAALVFTVSPRMWAKVHRTGCANNIRQQLVAFQMYAADHNNRYYWPAVSGTVDNAPRYLYPNYVNTLSTFVCPGTKNVVRENVKNRLTGLLVDLEDNANGAADSSGGYSYEYFGNFSIPSNHLIGTVEQPTRKRPNHYWREPHDTNLVVDGDDYKRQNFPDEGDNHGAEGWNWGFADGHVEWVTAAETPAAFARNGPAPR